MTVPFLNPRITEEDIAEVVRVLRSGWLVNGPDTKAFEAEFAAYLGTKDAVLTNSCTCSLELALEIAGIGPGHEVITTPLTYASTAQSIIRVGAKPVFVDVDPEAGLIRPDLVEEAITPATRGILPVHLYGQLADMRALDSIAKKHRLVIIEDAAHAIESERDGVRSGQLGLAACFSFHSAKNITAGQGGTLATNETALADRARVLRRDGVVNDGVYRRTVALGHKYQSTDMTAALLASQLRRIDAQWKMRQELFDRYAQAIAELGLKHNAVLPGSRHAYHMMVLWVPPERREGLLKGLLEAGIQVSIHYDPLHLDPYYRETFDFKEGDFPVAERLGHGTITLPLFPGMTPVQQDEVIAALKKLA